MILVNLYGQPGAGKSTGAMYITAKLKMAEVNAELVSEFAKDKVYEENKGVFDNQLYIFAKQWFRISRAEEKVDVIVTDSPILLSLFYNKKAPNKHLMGPQNGGAFTELVLNIYDDYDTINYFINRAKPYQEAGRFQTEAESDALVAPMREMLKTWEIEYWDIMGNQEGYDSAVDQILVQLNR